MTLRNVIHLMKENNMAPVNQNTYTNTMLKAIHSKLFKDILDQFKPNKLSDTETQLNRKSRTTLAKLRLGHCKIFNSYNDYPHDTAHLFRRTQHPTQLEVKNLYG